MKAIALIGCVTLASTPLPVFAQDIGPMVSSVGLGNIAMSGAINAAARSTVRRPSISRPSFASPQNARAASLTFASSLQRRRANYAQFVAKTRAVDPTGADNLATMLGQTDVIAAMGVPLAKYGLRTDNVADAYTVWWMNAWQAAHGDATEYGKATVQAVKAQAARAIGATAEFAGATNATKQEFAEALLIQGGLIDASVSKFKDDPDLMRQLRDAVRKGANASGMDLDAMTLTERGFVPVEK